MQQFEVGQTKENLSQAESINSQSRMHKALGAVKRLELMEVLRTRAPLSVKELAGILKISSSTTSRHTRELLNNSLVATLRSGKRTLIVLTAGGLDKLTNAKDGG